MEAVEELECKLQSKHYNECKQLVNEVLDYWAKIYPQLEWTWYDEEDNQLSEVRILPIAFGLTLRYLHYRNC